MLARRTTMSILLIAIDHTHHILSSSPRTHIRLGKLPRWNASLKENIQLSVCSVLGFRETEICPHEAEEAHPSPEASGFAFQFQAVGLGMDGTMTPLMIPITVVKLVSWDLCMVQWIEMFEWIYSELTYHCRRYVPTRWIWS